MRRKLLAVAERLGISTGKATRLAAAASDHAKEVTRKAVSRSPSAAGRIKSGERALHRLPLDPSWGSTQLLRLGFDRIEPLIDGAASAAGEPIARSNRLP